MSQTRKAPPHRWYGWYGYVYLLKCDDIIGAISDEYQIACLDFELIDRRIFRWLELGETLAVEEQLPPRGYNRELVGETGVPRFPHICDDCARIGDEPLYLIH